MALECSGALAIWLLASHGSASMKQALPTRSSA